MRSLTLFVAVAVLGCGPNVGGADEQDGSGTGTMSSSTSTSSSVTGPTTSVGPTSVGPSTSQGPGTAETGCLDTCATDTGPSPACEQTENFACTNGVDCAGALCGDLMSPFDENGCLRPVCNEGECPAGLVCFTPAEWGGCASSGIFCDEENGECFCGGDADCGGSYCVDENDAPPANCFAFDADEAMCVDEGCGPYLLGRPIVPVGGGSCICDLDEPRCLWLEPSTQQTPGKTAYFRPDGDGTAIVLDSVFEPPPLGYITCAPELSNTACDCAEVLPCAMD